MTDPGGEHRGIVGLDARAVRASVRVVSQASAADLARPTAFAPRVAVTGGGVLDEIVALLGRRPDWPG